MYFLGFTREVPIRSHVINYGFGYAKGSTLTVKVGDTVEWNGVSGHTITWYPPSCQW